jgi:DNA adenine methylase Dam
LSKKYLKSPFNYTGGKYKLLEQIMPEFPKEIDTFVDLFAGGFNVGINVKADKIIYNDIVDYLVDLFKAFNNNSTNYILSHIKKRIDEYNLSKTNEEGYKALRNYYNKEKNPLDLYVLICYSFNYQIRFNNSHEYNNSFGRNRSRFSSRLEKRLIKFVNKLHEKKIEFFNVDFNKFDISILEENDFVYCDPPYLISTGSYNDGRRGFKGWSLKEEKELLILLDKLTNNGVKFALSNVLEHKGNNNELLYEWSKDYNIIDLNKDYINCNYQAKNNDKFPTREVLITNYEINESKSELKQLEMSF